MQMRLIFSRKNAKVMITKIVQKLLESSSLRYLLDLLLWQSPKFVRHDWFVTMLLQWTWNGRNKFSLPLIFTAEKIMLWKCSIKKELSESNVLFFRLNFDPI